MKSVFVCLEMRSDNAATACCLGIDFDFRYFDSYSLFIVYSSPLSLFSWLIVCVPIITPDLINSMGLLTVLSGC